MANASAKRIAGQNEASIKTLKVGMFAPTILYVLLRLLFKRSTLPPSKFSLAIYIVTFIPAFFLSNYLVKTGSPRRDPTTGALISYGEDLNQRGVIEWCFDILYITWICQIGSGALGDWVWWLYMVIPVYAIFKLWTSVISPMAFGNKLLNGDTGSSDKESISKRQEKLRKRDERGDPRVKTRHVKK